MKTLLTFVGLFTAAISMCVLEPAKARGAEPVIRVMLLTGQCSQYHNWGLSSAILKRVLEQPGVFTVSSVVTPPKGGDMSGFKPDFTRYDVVVMDYEGDDWPEPTREAFAEFIRNGGGLVSFHATDNTFPKWTEFNEMIGVGGWGGRTAAAGPKVRWRDGKMVLDDSPGTAGHPPSHDFQITVRAPEHPVMRGLPEKWMHPHDELYSQLRGPAKQLEVLATALADRSRFPNASGEHEPVLMAIRFGKGRIFHTTLGHVGPRDAEPLAQMNCVGFILTLQRGTEWAATGKVTLPVPADFPTADKTSLRPQKTGE
jgi:type 1 glutamine amidotransferase